MKIVVCIRQGTDGEINPFDACAYEAALQVRDADVTLLSMGAPSVGNFLLNLTRLGAKKAVLLSDSAFAGADTLATAYTLSLAVGRLAPDLVFCGRQTLVGDTAQTGAMLSVMAGYNLITNVMRIDRISAEDIYCETRTEGTVGAALPALITVERINTLRLPGLRSGLGELVVWDAAALGADRARCGLAGSPTRVLRTYENEAGKRHCRMISREELPRVIAESLLRNKENTMPQTNVDATLKRVMIVGESPMAFAKTVSNDITLLPLTDAVTLAEQIGREMPTAVIWGSDAVSKRISAQVAAMLSLGLCADCTALGHEDGALIMYRPALSGSMMAKIKSLKTPAMATVRTESGDHADIIVGAGYGVRTRMEEVRQLADSLGASLAVSRKMVDNGYAPYEAQVGLTGKTVSPSVYLAIGISGAVHHIAGMRRSGTVIAINPDRLAPIFDYADFGIPEEF